MAGIVRKFELQRDKAFAVHVCAKLPISLIIIIYSKYEIMCSSFTSLGSGDSHSLFTGYAKEGMAVHIDIG
jgi:hypothetical protein